jgi:hypothetical protein
MPCRNDPDVTAVTRAARGRLPPTRQIVLAAAGLFDDRNRRPGAIDVKHCWEKGTLRSNAIYSIFDSALYGSLNIEWLFSQEKATLHDLLMATCESKIL